MSNRGHELLDRPECEALLRTHSFGRIITMIGEAISAFPVYYTVVDGDICFRTDPGTKLAAAVLGAPVTFEVDDEAEGWSVMAFGASREEGAPDERSAIFAALGETWPDAERQRVVRIHPERVTGRRLRRPGAVDR